jgi:hypothetical protein
MISGKITIHKEPYSFKKPSYVYEGEDWHGGYGGGYSVGGWNRLNQLPTPTQSDLNGVIVRAAMQGFVVGARVKRSSGNPGVGIITAIHDKIYDALDVDLNEMTPFRVQWLGTVHGQSGGTYNYTLDDLSLYTSNVSNLPTVVNHETLPNIPLAY